MAPIPISTESFLLLENTIEFVLKLDPDYVFFGVPTPFPGTRFYQQCKESDIIKENNLLKYTIMVSVKYNPSTTTAPFAV